VLAAIEPKRGWVQEISPRLAKKMPGETDALIKEAFLRTLGREPTAREVERGAAHLAEVGNAIEGFQELLWALLNSREFLTNH
jgi:hypothetical protein